MPWKAEENLTACAGLNVTLVHCEECTRREYGQLWDISGKASTVASGELAKAAVNGGGEKAPRRLIWPQYGFRGERFEAGRSLQLSSWGVGVKHERGGW